MLITMLGQQSLRGRLIVQLGIIAAILSVVLFLAVRSVAHQAAQTMQDNILAASAASIVEAIRAERGQLQLDLPYSALSMLGAISDDRVFYRVVHDGETLTGYDDLDLPGGQGLGETSFSTTWFRGAEVRLALATRRISLGGQPSLVRVAVAQTQEGLERVSARLSQIALGVGVGFFVLAVALSALAAGQTLRPLRRLAGAVSRRGPGDLRPVDARAPEEIAPLVEALNRFIARLRTSLAQSEDFIAEAAHRVRTPLATVRAQAEIALHRVERPENKAALRRMIRAVDESSRSAGQLLDHAMVTFRADHMALEAVDLGALASDLVSRLAPLAELKDIGLSLRTPDAVITSQGDPILLQNALRNLIDNAVKYSPADGAVEVSVTRTAQHHVVTVSDSGPGFGDFDTARLSDRFERGPNVGDVVGSGLGLTICREVAEAHGGALELAHNDGGGACASLLLPR